MLALRIARARTPALGSTCTARYSTPSGPLYKAAEETASPAERPSKPFRKGKATKEGSNLRRQKALAKHKSLAEAIKKGGDIKMAPSSAYLDAKAANIVLPGIADLLAYKPAQLMRPTAQEYPARHAELVHKIDSAFNYTQINEFIRELGLGVRKPKAIQIQRILDAWGWEKPGPPVDVTKYTQEFALSTAELFLLQRDPVIGYWMANNPVDLTCQPIHSKSGDEPRAYTLASTGLRPDLDDFSRLLHSRMGSLATEVWDLTATGGWVPPRATMWGVATATGAFVEELSKKKFQAKALTREEALRARDMILRAAARATLTPPPLAITVPTSSQVTEPIFSLLPHIPSSSSPLPWDTAAAVADRPLFRLSQVRYAGDLESEHAREREQRVQRLQVAPTRPVRRKTVQEKQSLSEIASSTLESVPTPESGDRTLLFRFGHCLTLAADDNVSNALIAPIAGSWGLDPTSPLVAKLSTPVFSPALPPSLIQHVLPEAPRRIRRLTYAPVAAGDQSTRLVVEYAYPSAEEEPTSEELDMPSTGRSWVDELDEMISKQLDLPKTQEDNNEGMAMDMSALRGLIGETGDEVEAPREMVVTAELRTEGASDVLLPDRPIDARIIARASTSATLPRSLNTFFEQIHEHAQGFMSVGLDDLTGMRRGTGPLTKRTANDVAVGDTVSWETDPFGDDWVSELERGGAPSTHDDSLDTFVPPAEDVDEKVKEEIEIEAEPEPILPPRTIHVGFDEYHLERDEVLEVAERPVEILPMGGETVSDVPEPDVPDMTAILAEFEAERSKEEVKEAVEEVKEEEEEEATSSWTSSWTTSYSKPVEPAPEPEPTPEPVSTPEPVVVAPTPEPVVESTPEPVVEPTPTPEPTPSSDVGRVVGTLRTLASTDLTGSGGVIRYAELEALPADGGQVDGEIWRQLASVSRDVARRVR